MAPIDSSNDQNTCVELFKAKFTHELSNMAYASSNDLLLPFSIIYNSHLIVRPWESNHISVIVAINNKM